MRIFQIKKLEDFINKIETSRFNEYQLIVSFFTFVLIRCFLEIFSSNANFVFIQYYHYILFYISFALTFVFVLWFFTKEKIKNIFNIVLTSFFIIIFPPIIDLFFCGRGKCIITYLLPYTEYMDNLFYRFFLLGGKITSMGGITPGIKIELIIIFVFSSLYVFIKNRNFLKSFIYFIIMYCVVFLYMSVPIILKYLFDWFNVEFYYGDIYFINVYFVVITLLSLLILFFNNNDKLAVLLTGGNILRALYYIFLFFLGLFLSRNIIYNQFVFEENGSVFLTTISITTMLLLDILIVFCIHRIYYLKNKENSFYPKFLFVLLALIFIGSVAVGFNIFYITLLFVGLFFLYFSPPFLLRKNLIFSKIILGLVSLIAILIGYITGYAHQKDVNWNALLNSFPISLFFYSIVVGLASGFIDIKCYNNDRRNNIKTLLTLLGMENGKIVVGLLLFVAYLFIPFFFKMSIISIFIIYTISIIQFLLINKERYSENYVLGLVIFSLLLIILDNLLFI